ncbi:MAG: type II toxin-antitoxin system death-on-curing family toxin [Proteobacteria bacterium]|nr:type II toxin-antitoxin system death-on-curing family toxin [Pseudomonadota bacterium]
MTQYVVLTATEVVVMHDHIIGPHELQGLAKDRSLEAVLNRVHNRLQYGFISDVFNLAACYASFVARGRCFNDANKRTAATVLFFMLTANGIEIKFDGVLLGEWIIDVATDRQSEVEFASWLRKIALA